MPGADSGCSKGFTFGVKFASFYASDGFWLSFAVFSVLVAVWLLTAWCC
jgi:hypothetical protein